MRFHEWRLMKRKTILMWHKRENVAVGHHRKNVYVSTAKVIDQSLKKMLYVYIRASNKKKYYRLSSEEWYQVNEMEGKREREKYAKPMCAKHVNTQLFEVHISSGIVNGNKIVNFIFMAETFLWNSILKILFLNLSTAKFFLTKSMKNFNLVVDLIV